MALGHVGRGLTGPRWPGRSFSIRHGTNVGTDADNPLVSTTVDNAASCRGRPDLARARSVHSGGLAALAAFWPHEDAQRCHLMRTSE